MNARAFRRIAAIAGAATIATTFAVSGATAVAGEGQQDTTQDRPCFMIRSAWNDAEGPQPTCHIPRWQQAQSSDEAARPVISARIMDSMP